MIKTIYHEVKFNKHGVDINPNTVFKIVTWSGNGSSTIFINTNKSYKINDFNLKLDYHFLYNIPNMNFNYKFL
jgi:hypothetical protein